MRHRSHSRHLATAAVLAALALTVLVVFSVLLLSSPSLPTVPLSPVRFPWVGAPAGSLAVPLLWGELLVRSGTLFAVLVYAFLASIAVIGLYRRTSAGEAYFLHVFLLCLDVEALRLPSLYLYVTGARSGVLSILTRAVHMGRLLAVIALFMVALYALGLRYGGHGTAAAMGVLVAVMIAAFVPVDASRFTQAYLYAVSQGGGLLSVTTTAVLITLLAAGIAPLIRKERGLHVLTAGIVCLLGGYELELLGTTLTSASGLPLLIFGMVLAARRVEQFYLRIY